MDPQQIAPLQGPEIDVLGAVEQFVDEFGAFARGIARGERSNFVGSRERAGNVDENAANEGEIIRLRSRFEPHSLPLHRNQFIDEILRLEPS